MVVVTASGSPPHGGHELIPGVASSSLPIGGRCEEIQRCGRKSMTATSSSSSPSVADVRE
jgi:hypothetical protein